MILVNSKMDKETLLRLATPASIFALALSIGTLPLTVSAYDQTIKISGSVEIEGDDSIFHTPINIKCVSGCFPTERPNSYPF
tara:strand:- start:81 stop:326 length:246 start_codon:yes stop_codon:yes gene_type:complete